jgi:hypothetical protein
MTTQRPTRVRDVYEQYARGEIPFDRVIEASEAFLERWAREHPAGPNDEPARALRPQP